MAERRVIDGTEPHSDFEELLGVLDELHVPDGHKAEIIRGSIVASPWPKGYCNRVMRLVCKRLEPYLSEGHQIDYGPFLFVFPGEASAFGPDIHAAHEQVFETESNHLDSEGLVFAAELTSPSTRRRDVTEKPEVYARAGVPVYLLLDMAEEQATVFWSPSVKGYESHCTMPFGGKLPMPAPFDCHLDTAGFAAPAKGVRQ